MASVAQLRNQLIDQLLTIDDKELLAALLKLIGAGSVSSGEVSLTELQNQALAQSDQEIAAGKLTAQKDVDADDLAWLDQWARENQ